MKKISTILLLGIVLYASVAEAIMPYLLRSLTKSASRTVASRVIYLNPIQINQDIRGFLDEFYQTHGLDYEVVDSGQGYYRVHLDSIKSHLISNHNYWESFDVLLVVSRNNGGWDVLCDVSGFYSPGIGGSLPDRSSYYSINKDFPDSLTSYSANLVGKFEEYVITKEQERKAKEKQPSE